MICSKKVKTKCSSTTNLWSHLSQMHPSEFIRSKPPKKATTTSSKPSVTKDSGTLAAFIPYGKDSPRAKQITAAVTYCVAKDMLPTHAVEKPGLTHLIKTLDKQYQLPSSQHFKRTAIPALYAQVSYFTARHGLCVSMFFCQSPHRNIFLCGFVIQVRDEVQRSVSDAKYFCVTSDIWSSVTMQPYLSLTIHFIDNEFGLQSKCLAVSYFPEDHTGIGFERVEYYCHAVQLPLPIDQF